MKPKQGLPRSSIVNGVLLLYIHGSRGQSLKMNQLVLQTNMIDKHKCPVFLPTARLTEVIIMTN